MRHIRSLAALGAAVALVSCSPQSPAPAEAAAPAYYIGDAVPADRSEVRVTKVERRDAVGVEFLREPAAEGGVLVAVRYTIKNTSEQPLKAYAAPQLTLIDPKGVEYKPDVGKSGAYATELNLDQKLASDLNPGIIVKGATVFEVGKELFDPTTWKLVVGGRRGLEIALADKPAAPSPEAKTASQPASKSIPPAAQASPSAVELDATPVNSAPAPEHATASAPARSARMPDFSARERRLAGLIENASMRDANGDVDRQAARARAERARCASVACIERSYTVQEASLRQWDGADEIR